MDEGQTLYLLIQPCLLRISRCPGSSSEQNRHSPCPHGADGLVGDERSPKRSMGFSVGRETKASLSSEGKEGRGSGKFLQLM